MPERSAKEIIVKSIDQKSANAFIQRHHYSGKVVLNSKIHFGVYLDKKLEGVMQFGSSLDKKKTLSVVRNTPWNGFLELNRMAFTDVLPRNSESRAISVALRILKKEYPFLKWVISFADACQCGDGTIYRASGFLLTGIKKNNTIWELNGVKFTDIGFRISPGVRSIISKLTLTSGRFIKDTGGSSMKYIKDCGARPLPGYQIRYIYFFDPEFKKNLTVPVLSYDKIKEIGASMYKGKKGNAGVVFEETTGYPPGEDGATPILPLQSNEKEKAKTGNNPPA